ncbi:MAG: helix-hairpin-helix domain-containing protein [Pseudomonadota bacterium]
MSFSPRQQWLALALSALLLAGYGVRYYLLAPPEPRPVPAAAQVESGAVSPVPVMRLSSPTPSKKPAGHRASGKKRPPSRPVDVNSATVAQLQAVPGIGPVTARRIVETRTRMGGFSSLDDLKKVKGIKDKRLARFAPCLRVSVVER